MGDILATLAREHDELRRLFGRLNATRDEDTTERRQLLEEIEANLVPHAKWEEMVFYPAFEERASHEQKLLYAAAMQEHRAVEQSVMPDLHAASVDSRQFAGSAKVFGELIDHHATEEENEMFSVARTLFSGEELARFDREYAEWKESTLAGAVGMHAKVKTAAKAVFRKPDAPG
jgi:hemerythrin-like domain-containing protein